MGTGTGVYNTFQQGVLAWRHASESDTQLPLVVAVSGGLDSMVLWHCAKRTAQVHRIPLCAVHVNHGIRPNAATDAAFVENMGVEWRLPVVVKSVHMTDILPSLSRGIEADARTLRYQAFREVAKSVDAGAVLLAHHADDQVETVLWRLVRGTSLTGVAGLRPVSIRDGVTWLRPLLQFEKTELMAYAKEHSIPHVEDESNANPAYTRNYLRHHVVPQLKKIQPGLAKHISQFSDIVAEEDAYLEAQATAWVKDHVTVHGETYHVPIRQLTALARPLQRRVIKIILFYCLATVEWARAHVEGVLAIVEGENPSGEVHLHHGLSARRQYGTLLMGSQVPPQAPYHFPWRLFEGSRMRILCSHSEREWTFVCHRWDSNQGTKLATQLQLLVPPFEEVVLQSADTSHRLDLLGTDGTKKVQDIFVNHKVPRGLRCSWPAVYYAGHLLWLPGLARSRRYLVDAGTSTHAWVITGTLNTKS